MIGTLWKSGQHKLRRLAGLLFLAVTLAAVVGLAMGQTGWPWSAGIQKSGKIYVHSNKFIAKLNLNLSSSIFMA